MSKKNYKNIYQFKVVLKDIKPPVWRRIQVPENYTFWDLHVAIQDSFGWDDYHLHEFRTIDPQFRNVEKIGIPDEEFGMEDIMAGWEQNIKDWFSLDGRTKMNYEYDFGDGWEHFVILEKILPRKKDIKYPICIKGKRACPPEDSGGVWGYTDKLKIIKDQKHELHKDIVEWMGDDFDPDEFNIEDIYFDDPRERMKEGGILSGILKTKENMYVPDKIKKLKEMNLTGEMDWEIDYSPLPMDFEDEAGDKFKPYLMGIVHPESYFVIKMHVANPNQDYLNEFLDEVMNALIESEFYPKRILVKKQEFFNKLKKELAGLNIEIKLVKRTKAVEDFKRRSATFFRG